MTIVTNNNINNVSLMLNSNQSGLMSGDGTVLTGNFLDIISMLSDTPNLNLTNISDAELLKEHPNNDTVFSTLQLLQKLFEENEINSKTNIAPELFSKFFEIVNDNKNTTDNSKLDVFEIVPCALSDLESIPNEKILVVFALGEILHLIFTGPRFLQYSQTLLLPIYILFIISTFYMCEKVKALRKSLLREAKTILIE